MKGPDEIPALREALDQLTTIADPAEYAASVEAMRGRFNHSIYVVPGEPQDVSLKGITCFGYALQLHRSARWADIARDFASVNTPFIERLIRDGILRAVSGNEVAAIVVYHHRARVRHAGRMAGDRVVSKWGTNFVFEHALWEVPAAYGAPLSFHGMPDAAAVAAAFFEHLRTPERRYFGTD